MDLSAYEGRALDARVLREATDRVMDAITSLLEQIRGERRPERVHDPRRALALVPAARRTA